MDKRSINDSPITVIILISLALISAIGSRTMLSGKAGHPLSPTAFVVDEDNNQIIVAQKTGQRVDFLNGHSGVFIGSVETHLLPTGICLGAGDRAYVSCSNSEGEVLVIDVKAREVLKEIKAGHGAVCPIVSPVSDKLYVANQYDDDISVIDLKTDQEVRRIKVRRQPMTMDITPDGKWLVVANLLPATRADIDTVAAEVTIIDLVQNKVAKHLKLSNGSNALRGIRVSPDGIHAYVAHNLGRFQVPTSQLEQGWMNTSALTIINIPDQEVWATILLDEPENGAAGSWGVDVNSEAIAVTHSGTHDYSLIDHEAMLRKLGSIEDPATLSYDLSFLTDIRRRYALKGEGPRAIHISSGKLFTGLYFSDAIQVDDLSTMKNIAYYDMNPQLVIDSVRLGEMIFNDARHCFQQWQSCNGCHPNDARTDGLNWDLLNDGIGNPKNCKSLLLAHETPPSMMTGIRPTAEIAVRAGFRHIQFAQVEERDARAVDHYLKSLKPVPSPYLVDGKLSEQALRGEQVFLELNCGFCHNGAHYTDGKMHEIGIPGESDRTNKWDTPTLIETWRTAPYLHDGRSATLYEVFVNEKHGIKTEIGFEKMQDLIAFVLSL